MFDRIFSAALAFVVLAAGTLAVGTAMLEHPQPELQVQQMPRVEVIGKRLEASLAHAEQASAAPRVD
ncbi:MAG TPA: hypothetical protein VJ743_03590 [Albitalea sp.]|nr:hypothetical protein [Albitalea sp.]